MNLFAYCRYRHKNITQQMHIFIQVLLLEQQYLMYQISWVQQVKPLKPFYFEWRIFKNSIVHWIFLEDDNYALTLSVISLLLIIIPDSLLHYEYHQHNIIIIIMTILIINSIIVIIIINIMTIFIVITIMTILIITIIIIIMVGCVYAVEFAHRPGRDLINMAKVGFILFLSFRLHTSTISLKCLLDFFELSFSLSCSCICCLLVSYKCDSNNRRCQTSTEGMYVLRHHHHLYHHHTYHHHHHHHSNHHHHLCTIIILTIILIIIIFSSTLLFSIVC